MWAAALEMIDDGGYGRPVPRPILYSASYASPDISLFLSCKASTRVGSTASGSTSISQRPDDLTSNVRILVLDCRDEAGDQAIVAARTPGPLECVDRLRADVLLRPQVL